MVRRPHFLAWMLSVEGSTLLLSGSLLAVAAMTGRVTTLAGGADTGALALCLWPLLEWACCALGVVIGLLGVAGLVVGVAAFQKRALVATRTVLLAYSVPWAMLATLACLRAGSPSCDVAISLAAGAIAAAIGLLHLIAACTPRERPLMT